MGWCGLRIAICDDELICAEEIENNVRGVLTEKSICAKVDIFTDCTVLYKSGKAYDIAFLDIGMSPYDGLTLAKHLKDLNENTVIFFITSYDKYLDNAMDLNAFRYIQKPIDVKRFKSGFKKAIDNITDANTRFFVHDGQSFVSVSTENIVLVQISGRRTQVITTDKVYQSNISIDSWEEQLASPLFFRVHKSYIVNMNYITDYSRSRLVLCSNYDIPIAYRKQSEFRNCFMNFFGGQ